MENKQDNNQNSPDISGITNTHESNNYGQIITSLVADILTFGSYEFAIGLRNLIIQIFANFYHIFLKTSIGERYFNAFALFIGYMILQLLAVLNGYTGMFSGYDVDYYYFSLFAKCYLYMGVFQGAKIWYRRKFNPKKIIYSESRGSSYLYPHFLKISKQLKLPLLSEFHYQKYVETSAVILIAFVLRFVLSVSFSNFIIFISLSAYFEIVFMEKNLREKVLSATDSKLMHNAMMECLTDEKSVGISKNGVILSPVVINEIKKNESLKRSQKKKTSSDSELDELVKNQIID